MKAQVAVKTEGVPWNPDIPAQVQHRIRLWMIYARDTERLTHEALADRIGLSEPTVTNIINAKRRAGFDALVGLVFGVGLPADLIMKREPEGVTVPGGSPPSPASASPSTAEPGKRKTGGRSR